MSLGEGETAAPDVSTTDPLYVLASTTVQTHSYVTQSGKIIRETVTSADTATQLLDFLYDENGRPFALKYTNGTADPVTYYYVLNLQGDVVGLIDSSGTYVAQYTYTAWGEILTATGTMAEINPLRYRGYYYDTETGFYYLQSRYYDPVTHRFINADSLASTGQGFTGTNMFAYCGNNPITMSDSSGCIPNAVHSLYEMHLRQDNSHGFGNLYYSMHSAAIAAGTEANLLTSQTEMEYICGIYAIDYNGTTLYYYGEIHEGTHNTADPESVLGEVSHRGSTLVALLHTHGNCTGHDNLNFSIGYGENGELYKDAGTVQEYGYPLYMARYDGWLLLLTLENNIPCTTYVIKALPVDETAYPCY